MKKVLAILLVICICATITACRKDPATEQKAGETVAATTAVSGEGAAKESVEEKQTAEVDEAAPTNAAEDVAQEEVPATTEMETLPEFQDDEEALEYLNANLREDELPIG